MAKANRTGTEKGRENKYTTQTHCSGFCGEVERLCDACVDWGELKRQEALKRTEDDTPQSV